MPPKEIEIPKKEINLSAVTDESLANSSSQYFMSCNSQDEDKLSINVDDVHLSDIDFSDTSVKSESNSFNSFEIIDKGVNSDDEVGVYLDAHSMASEQSQFDEDSSYVKPDGPDWESHNRFLEELSQRPPSDSSYVVLEGNSRSEDASNEAPILLLNPSAEEFKMSKDRIAEVKKTIESLTEELDGLKALVTPTNPQDQKPKNRRNRRNNANRARKLQTEESTKDKSTEQKKPQRNKSAKNRRKQKTKETSL